jgi:lambda repressor-like predicted transcriptional regulator
MSGVGKTTAARVLARRYDLHLYSLDSRTYAHAEAMNASALRMTPDELWIERTPEQMADDFESEARLRFPLVVADLAALPDDSAPVIADGPQLLPELVSAPALFVLAQTSLQRELLARRGSFTPSRTRDPERAQAQRVRRDELLAARLRAAALQRGSPVVEIADVRETEAALAQRFAGPLREWLTRRDRGDVGARRRGENDRRFDQWRRYAAVEPRARDGVLELACECDRAGCTATVPVRLEDPLRRPLLAH